MPLSSYYYSTKKNDQSILKNHQSIQPYLFPKHDNDYPYDGQLKDELRSISDVTSIDWIIDSNTTQGPNTYGDQ